MVFTCKNLLSGLSCSVTMQSGMKHPIKAKSQQLTQVVENSNHLRNLCLTLFDEHYFPGRNTIIDCHPDIVNSRGQGLPLMIKTIPIQKIAAIVFNFG